MLLSIDMPIYIWIDPFIYLLKVSNARFFTNWEAIGCKKQKTTPIVTWSCVAFCCTSILLFMLPDNVVFSPFVTSFILSFAFLRFFFIHFFLFVVLPLRILKKRQGKEGGREYTLFVWSVLFAG
ncbi:hypothetical protein, unlikely [Trypanosoma brucei brucei TREU927]|uniref:Uncharacterized protein n=1 Tax=Trypanosoma brucei brucei (strain 927/4 GUTat10.1) TaxID=185431 RepID=Q38D70_TRYB2|nr:hypothetical protein, unlikely [Trypanosoma brucei brucei TREU927]EAN77250.1 hypothetical protein, unlikely [Trypanosoma brucei brucei TREU927]